MEIPRPQYLDRLIQAQDLRMIKIITGMRRCGKSYLLFRLFRDYLLASGVRAENIIEFRLDSLLEAEFRDPYRCLAEIKERASGQGPYYVLIDEVQLMDRFVEFGNSLLQMEQVSAYFTGSNAKFLSSEVATEFRGRGWSIPVAPLSFAEFLQVPGNQDDIAESWRQYYRYGGLPEAALLADESAKVAYLDNLLQTEYLRDIVERHQVRDGDKLADVLRAIASAVGSPTNPERIARTFASSQRGTVDGTTVRNYLQYFEDAFLVQRADRFDVKGRKYLATPAKYYFTDLGLRNAVLGFRQVEENHLMENTLYNDLVARGFKVDVGVLGVTETVEGKRRAKQLEIDFVAQRGPQQLYLQSALDIDLAAKAQQEYRPLLALQDNWRKILVVKHASGTVTNEGIEVANLYDFLRSDL